MALCYELTIVVMVSRTIAAIFCVMGVFHPGHVGSGDSVQPRDTISVVQSVVPDPQGAITVDIVGGDTFVRVRSRGATVLIPGYENEEYLKIDADGTVSMNIESISSFINSTRYGSPPPTNFVPTTFPRWKVIARNGTAMWHDHRSHWMSPKRPAVIDRSGTVLEWKIPISVNGISTIVTGSLFLHRSASALWWLFGLPFVVLAVLVASLRRQRSAELALVVSAAAMIVGAIQYFGLPSQARVTPVMLGFATFSAAIAAIAARRKSNDATDGALCAGAGLTMAILAWLLREQVHRAYIPGLSAEWCARGVIVACLATGVVTTLAGITKVIRHN